jgi:signal transduction histidine kinase
LIEEIVSQRDLAAAENGDIVVHPRKIGSRQLMREVADEYRHHPSAHRKSVVIDHLSCDVEFTSDPALLARVLANLVKNGLEASTPGQTVVLQSSLEEGSVVFRVRNEGVMPAAVQLQIYQRSFSTKGADRGLGTYSTKLLTERYLKGQATFVSNAELGTVFSVRLPRSDASFSELQTSSL